MILKKIWLYFLKAYVRLGFAFFYKKINVTGLKNLPANKPLIYLPNHKNTFLDAMIIATTQHRYTHYMARGDIFTGPRVKWWATAINLRPIYRIRDGKAAVAKNQQVFEDLISFLGRNECVMLHPEGTHSLEYRVRSISKGFTRIASGALEKHPQLDVQIVPVGINYSDPLNYRSRLNVSYGEPIPVKPFFEAEDQAKAAVDLKDLVEEKMKGLTVHIPPENYKEIYEKLEQTNTDFSDPIETQQRVRKAMEGKKIETLDPQHRMYWFEKALFPLVYLNNIFLILLWKKIKPIFKDKAFYASIKFVLGCFVLPILYLVQSLLVAWFANWVWALIYLYFSILTVSILSLRKD